MTKFVLVRHGEPTYDELMKLGYNKDKFSWGPLTDEGVSDVLKTAENKIFDGSDILISSPYTRAMQTASIIGAKCDLMINPEILLHEWLPGTFNSTSEFVSTIHLAYKEYLMKKENPDFVYSDNFESFEHVQKRVLSVLEKYTNYDKVIVVAHGILISTLFDTEVRLHTAEFTTITSDELSEKYDFKVKKLTKC